MPLDHEFMPGAFKKNVSRLKFGFCFLVTFKFGDNLRNQTLKRHTQGDMVYIYIHKYIIIIILYTSIPYYIS